MNISLNNRPLISVVIPTYNHAQFIGKCLQSVIDQSYSNWEIIVINNFSEDNTIDIVNSFNDQRIKLINFKNNGIIAASRNEGIRNVKGEFIAFLDSDDYWYNNKLEKCVEMLKDNDVVYHNLDIYNKNGKQILKKIRGRKLFSPAFVDLMINGNALANSGTVVRKSIIDMVGFLDEDTKLVAAEDFDLWLRVSKVTERFKFLPLYLGSYWLGGGNVTKPSTKAILMYEKIYNKHKLFLNDCDREQSEYFKTYAVARIKQKMGHYKEAFKLFKTVLKVKKMELKFKAIFFFLFCFFKDVTN